MVKKVVIAGLLGWVVLIVWGFVVNGVFRFNSRVNLNQIPDDRRVYQFLKETITEPGRYIINPELTASGLFPDGDPVYSIHYSGLGHDAARELMLLQLAILLLIAMIAAWIMSLSSHRMLSSYPRKVLYFIAIGLLFSGFSFLTNFRIDRYPLTDALLLAIHDVSLWTILGLVLAWRITPEPASTPDSLAGHRKL
ncbi:MAG: hypothetical protein WBB69_14940 [Anaerolineales bacterium]